MRATIRFLKCGHSIDVTGRRQRGSQYCTACGLWVGFERRQMTALEKERFPFLAELERERFPSAFELENERRRGRTNRPPQAGRR